ncbi:hypothetical protein LQZ18_09790 [Lachnospiraceae bacterium ZAX-1]
MLQKDMSPTTTKRKPSTGKMPSPMKRCARYMQSAKMLEDGIDPAFIQKYTGLDIEKLKKM